MDSPSSDNLSKKHSYDLRSSKKKKSKKDKSKYSEAKAMNVKNSETSDSDSDYIPGDSEEEMDPKEFR